MGGLKSGEHLVEVAARLIGGRPRRPSLPPNSTMTTSGCSSRMERRIGNCVLVVAPLVPWLLTL